MIVTASKENIDAIGIREYASTRMLAFIVKRQNRRQIDKGIFAA